MRSVVRSLYCANIQIVNFARFAQHLRMCNFVQLFNQTWTSLIAFEARPHFYAHLATPWWAPRLLNADLRGSGRGKCPNARPYPVPLLCRPWMVKWWITGTTWWAIQSSTTAMRDLYSLENPLSDVRSRDCGRMHLHFVSTTKIQ